MFDQRAFNASIKTILFFCRSFHWQMEDQHNNLVANNGYNTSSHPTDYIGPPEPKRRIVSGETVVHFEAPPLVGQQHATQPTVTSGYYYPVIPRNEARAIVLEDENALLRKKIEELKKQVSFISCIELYIIYILCTERGLEDAKY